MRFAGAVELSTGLALQLLLREEREVKNDIIDRIEQTDSYEHPGTKGAPRK